MCWILIKKKDRVFVNSNVKAAVYLKAADDIEVTSNVFPVTFSYRPIKARDKEEKPWYVQAIWPMSLKHQDKIQVFLDVLEEQGLRKVALLSIVKPLNYKKDKK